MKKIITLLVCLLTAFSAYSQKNNIRRQKINVSTTPAPTTHSNGKTNRARIAKKRTSTKAVSPKSSQYYVNIGYNYYNGTGGKRESNFQAFTNWKRAANMGNTEGMALTAYCYYYGIGTSEDNYAAINWFKKAANKGDAFSMCYLGHCHRFGYGTSQDPTSALYWYKQAANNGYAGAYSDIGNMYENGEGVAQDYSQAYNYYQQGANRDDGACLCALGRFYLYGNGVQADPAAATNWFQKSADAGYGQGCFWLGYSYFYGYGVAEDNYAAVRWFRKGEELGSGDCMLYLGYCYQSGYGVTKSEYSALSQYKKAFDAGSSDAAFDVGYCYTNGVGTSSNSYTAFTWYKKGADAGSARCMYATGSCYASGTGTSKDLTTAVDYYQKGAALGDANCLNELGNAYYSGTGIAQNDDYAAKCYSSAINAGSTQAWGNLGLMCLQGKVKEITNSRGGIFMFLNGAGRGDASCMYGLGICFEYGRGENQNLYFAKRWLSKAVTEGYTEARSELSNVNSFDGSGGRTKIKTNPEQQTVQSNVGKSYVTYVYITSDYTAVGVQVNNNTSEDNWYYIEPATYIETPDGNRYYLCDADGIGISQGCVEQMVVKANQHETFTLYFQPIPKKTKSINLIEDNDNSDWKYYNVQIDD